MIAWCIRVTAASSLTCESGIPSRSVCTSLARTNPGFTSLQRLERANHQARADEQHERQGNLGNDERVARAMAVPGSIA